MVETWLPGPPLVLQLKLLVREDVFPEKEAVDRRSIPNISIMVIILYNCAKKLF